MARPTPKKWSLPRAQLLDASNFYSEAEIDRIIDLIGGMARAHSDEVKTTIFNVAGVLNFSLYLASRPTDPEKRARLEPIKKNLVELAVLFDQLDPDTAATLHKVAEKDPYDPRAEPKRVDSRSLLSSALKRQKYDGFGRERSHDPDISAPLEEAVNTASGSLTPHPIKGPHGATRYRKAIEGLTLLRAWTDTALNELGAGKKGRRRLDAERETAKALLEMKEHYNRLRGSRVTERGLLDLLQAVASPVFARYDLKPQLADIVREVLPTYKPSKTASWD